MTPADARALGLRLVATRLEVAPGALVTSASGLHTRTAAWGALPPGRLWYDLTDAATRGAVLEGLRRAEGDPCVWLALGHASPTWAVLDRRGRALCPPVDSEAEALVMAAESLDPTTTTADTW